MVVPPGLPGHVVPDESWFRLEDPSLTAGGFDGADAVATTAAPATAAASGDGEHLVVGAAIRALLQLVALGAARREVQTAVAVEEPDAAVARVFHGPLVVSLVLALASYGYWTAFAPASREARRMTTSLPLARGCDGPFHADCHIRASVVAVRSCAGLPCPTR
ncbi:hypothetical protein GCM10023097_10390 [Streptomyces collinus]